MKSSDRDINAQLNKLIDFVPMFFTINIVIST